MIISFMEMFMILIFRTVNAEINILLINCGGTISMIQEDGVLVARKGNLNRILEQDEHFVKLQDNKFGYGDSVVTIMETIKLLDSSDLKPTDWNEILDIISANQSYDSFIILHGTDTMAYTAAALSFMINNFKKTIIITGSQTPLSAPDNDAISNLTGALDLAGKINVSNLVVFFHQQLFLGTRIKKLYTSRANGFSSPNFPVIWNQTEENWKCIKETEFTDDVPTFCKVIPLDIRIIKIYPGINLNDFVDLKSSTPKAIILETFGTGNTPSNPEFINKLKEWIAKNILIINITQCVYGGINRNYLSGKKLWDIGVINGGDMTVEATFCKLYYLLSNFSFEKAKEKFNTNLKNEISK